LGAHELRGFAITEKYIELNNLQIAGEIKEPKRVLKLGVFLSIGIVTVLYMLVTAAYVSPRETRYRATRLTLGTSILLCLTRLLMIGRLSRMKGSHLFSARRFEFLRGKLRLLATNSHRCLVTGEASLLLLLFQRGVTR
jgi:uncharacterized membrane protein YqjE